MYSSVDDVIKQRCELRLTPAVFLWGIAMVMASRVTVSYTQVGSTSQLMLMIMYTCTVRTH